MRNFILSEKLKADNEYIVKIWLKGIQNDNAYFTLGDQRGFLVNLERTFSSATNIEFTGKIKMPRDNSGELVLLREPVDESWYQFEKIKIEKGNKPTDYTPAPEDLRQEFEQIESNVNIANEMLADIASDNKLTPSEKQLLKKEYDIILAEKPQLQAQANVYGVSTINYTNSYNNLVIYTNPLLVNLNSTTDIVGAVLRSTFATYFTAKINLLKAVTDKINNDITVVNQAVINAQTTANTAQNLINDIANDNKLTATEKQSLALEFNRIKTEYNQNHSIATTLGLNVTTYQTVYNNLNSYITPLLANLTITSDIVGTTFRTNFQNYYNVNIAIVTAIENKKIENIKIGGRNLILKSKEYNTSVNLFFADGVGHVEIYEERMVIIGNLLIVPKFTKKFVHGKEYTFSFSIKSFEPNRFISINFNGQSKNNISVTTADDRAFFTFVFDETKNKTTIYFAIPNGGLSLADISMEEGNKASAWTPAAEDLQNQIDANTNNTQLALAQAQNAIDTANRTANITSFLNTTIDNNVVATGTVLVGDVVGANGGITGVTDNGMDSVSLWFGSDYVNRNTAPFRVTQGGKVALEMKSQSNSLQGVYIENGNFIWRDNAGLIRRTIGWENGFPIDKSYSSGGILLYEFNAYGFHSYAIPDGFTQQAFFKVNNSNINESASNLSSLITPYVTKDGGRKQYTDPETGHIELYWEYYLTLNKNYNCWLYQAGNIDPNNYQYQGFKTSNIDKTLNVPNGWYVRQTGEIGREITKAGGSVTAWIGLYFLEDGKIIKSISLSLLK